MSEHKYQIRIEEEDFEKFKKLCKNDGRSVNAQICQMIKQYIKFHENIEKENK